MPELLIVLDDFPAAEAVGLLLCHESRCRVRMHASDPAQTTYAVLIFTADK